MLSTQCSSHARAKPATSAGAKSLNTPTIKVGAFCLCVAAAACKAENSDRKGENPPDTEKVTVGECPLTHLLDEMAGSTWPTIPTPLTEYRVSGNRHTASCHALAASEPSRGCFSSSSCSRWSLCRSFGLLYHDAARPCHSRGA
jgi:hypothetical protein